MNKGLRRLGILLLINLVMTVSLTADERIAYAFRVPVAGELSEGELYKVHLRGALLEKTKRDFSDIRVISAEGLEVPCVILPEVRPHGGQAHKIYTLTVTGYSDDGPGAIIVARLPDRSDAVRRLHLEIAESDFRKEVLLAVSPDGISWRPITSDAIYDFSSRVNLRKTHIDFSPEAGPYFQITLVEASSTLKREIEQSIRLQYKDLVLNVENLPEKNIRIRRITAGTRTDSEGDERVLDTLSLLDYTVTTDKEKRTRILFSWRHPIEKVHMEFGAQAVHRNVALYEGVDEGECAMKLEKGQALARGLLYKPIPGEGGEVRDTLEVGRASGQVFMIVIENKDNPPLAISEVSVSWTRHNLFFLPPAGTGEVAIYFGFEDALLPRYDTTHFVNAGNWYTRKFTTLDMGPVTKNEHHLAQRTRRQEETTRKNILTAVTFLLAGIFGYWLWSLSRNSGTQDR